MDVGGAHLDFINADGLIPPLDKIPRQFDIHRMPKRPETSALTFPDISLDAVLSFLKDTRGAVNWSAKDLWEWLKLDTKQAQQILAILEMQGYIAKDDE